MKVTMLVLFLFLGCSQLEKMPKKEIHESVAGLKKQKVFIPIERVYGGHKKYKNYKLSPPRMYKNCKQVEVIDFLKWMYSQNVLVKQDDKYFIASGGNYKLSSDDILKKLPGENRNIKLKTGTKKSHDLICKSIIWTGMKINEFLFIKGHPDKINRTTYRSGTQEQWIYEISQYKRNYYYFRKGVLTSWQD